MSIKNESFKILRLLIGLDVALTILFVKFFGATEINPLCVSFFVFTIIIIIIIIISLYIIKSLQIILGWLIFVSILICIYGSLLIFNLMGIINEFII